MKFYAVLGWLLPAIASAATMGPTSLTVVSGKVSSQPLSVLAREAQTGSDDNWNQYVEFYTPKVAFTGDFTFKLPAGARVSALLSRLQAGFNQVRRAGLKAIVRFSYNDGPYPDAQPDASKERILAHLRQLTPLLQPNADVIVAMQAGFVMARDMGYRFGIRSASFATQAQAGMPWSVTMAIENLGYAAPFNPRPVFLVLKNAAAKHVIALPGADPRRWAAGQVAQVDGSVTLPGAIAPGTYDFYLWLPDQADALRERPEYSIRLSNDGLWDSAAGMNRLGSLAIVP